MACAKQVLRWTPREWRRLLPPRDQGGGAATRKWVAFTLTVFLAFVIAILTLFPVSLLRPFSEGPDKIYHFIAFTGLMQPTSVL